MFIKKYRWIIGLPLTYVLINLLGKQTNFINDIYYERFYKPLAIKLRTFFNFTTISIGDCIYIALFIYIIYKCFFIKKAWKANKLKVINSICISLSLFLIVFNVLWGFNYYRTPLYERLDMKNTYSTKELIIVSDRLVERLNKIHSSYVTGISQKIVIADASDIIYEQTVDGYVVLSNQYPEFNYKVANIKSSIFSLPLTYMGFSGYLNPFTNEAQVNNKIPKINMLITASHEVAHQIGIGPEAEANFVGYLAAKNNPNKYFDYAATSFALRYCLNRYPFKNEIEFNTYLKKINPGILTEWKENKDFWESHQSFIDTIFKFMYDKFLKANKQEYGIEGYSKFLDLLIHYELNEKRTR